MESTSDKLRANRDKFEANRAETRVLQEQMDILCRKESALQAEWFRVMATLPNVPAEARRILRKTAKLYA